MTKLSSLGEFGWLDKLIPKLYWPTSLKSQLWIGPGDDAGAVRISPKKVLVATTDAMVEGIHFERSWFSWKDLGHKVLAVNLSDLAAMGDVKPVAALITVAIPGDTPVDNVDKFHQGMNNCAQRWKTGFLGGDTVGSKKGWFVSITALGEADPRYLIRRDTAKAGDYLVTSGPLGLAGAGLEVLKAGKSKLSWTEPLLSAFRQPTPRFEVSRLLARNGWATSLIDSSDGLEASVRLLSKNSRLGARVDLAALPIPSALHRWGRVTSRHPWEYALRGGEDYELIFTVRPTVWLQVKKAIPGCTVIGQMLPRVHGCFAHARKKRYDLKGYGFAHFSAHHD